MIWLFRSPIPVGRRGYFTCSNDFYLPSWALRKGEGVGTLWSGSEKLFRIHNTDYCDLPDERRVRGRWSPGSSPSLCCGSAASSSPQPAQYNHQQCCGWDSDPSFHTDANSESRYGCRFYPKFLHMLQNQNFFLLLLFAPVYRKFTLLSFSSAS